eukprot:261555-Hanusia_phi.AAC.2
MQSSGSSAYTRQGEEESHARMEDDSCRSPPAHVDHMDPLDDVLPIYQSMVRSLSKEPTFTRKVKLYAKTLLAFFALVLFWYAIYEILGYMVVGSITLSIEKAANPTNVTIAHDNQTQADGSKTKHIEGWITLAIGQSYFWLAVFLLVASQEIKVCTLSRQINETDSTEKTEFCEATQDGTVNGDANQHVVSVEGEERCFSTAKRGWQTPLSYILRWNWNCMLGVMAWMGLDFTCDSVHIIIQSLNEFFPRLLINFSFLVIANFIFISLNQINGNARTFPRAGSYRKAAKGKHYFRLNGARDLRRNQLASDKAADVLLQPTQTKRPALFQKLRGARKLMRPPFQGFFPEKLILEDQSEKDSIV